ncbi:Cell division protein FtsW [Mucinivorans hirudinis]|uniref:Probable peptidoglycan glycosyltransferase FtsW n=1 Tax=Mucinivorans hirudinis TaxID=1433126 RepID=A0A060RBB7_9BACT|nr:Cell division protein FtsW [Mucinivorans hirudinis]
MEKRRRWAPLRGDRSLWILVSLLLIFSLMVIYSATNSKVYIEGDAAKGDTSYYLFRQLRFVIMGFVAMVIIHWVNFKFYARFLPLIFYISVILVIMTALFGKNVNEASRSLTIPVFGSFQTIEMLKISLVALLALRLGRLAPIINDLPLLPSLTRRWRDHNRNTFIWQHMTLALLLPVVLACGAIMPMNLSGAILIFAISMAIFLVARVRAWQVVKVSAMGGAVIVVLVAALYIFGVGRAQVWVSRVDNYVAPLFGKERILIQPNDKIDTVLLAQKKTQEKIQSDNAKIAIIDGGIAGKGAGNSLQRSNLPLAYSDYAYALIIEEYGLLGGVAVVVIYIWIFSRAVIIIRQCRSVTLALLVMGLALMITIQAFLNIFVCVGLFPVTGQPLPLLSMGGTSVLFTCVAFGMMLSVSRQNDKEKAMRAKLQAPGAEPKEEEHPPQQEYEEFIQDYAELIPEQAEQDYFEEGEQEQLQSEGDMQPEDDDDFPFELVDRATEDVEAQKKDRETVELY